MSGGRAAQHSKRVLQPKQKEKLFSAGKDFQRNIEDHRCSLVNASPSRSSRELSAPNSYCGICSF